MSVLNFFLLWCSSALCASTSSPLFLYKHLHLHRSSQVYSTVAIIITAVEEALIRTTIVERDSFFLRLFGAEKPTAKEREYQKQVWAISICQSMTAEFCAIILSRSLYLLFRPHRYVFNLGYGGEGLDSGLIVINLFLELSGEALIDILAVYTEVRAGLPLGKYFDYISPLSGTYTLFCKVKACKGHGIISSLVCYDPRNSQPILPSLVGIHVQPMP